MTLAGKYGSTFLFSQLCFNSKKIKVGSLEILFEAEKRSLYCKHLYLLPRFYYSPLILCISIYCLKINALIAFAFLLLTLANFIAQNKTTTGSSVWERQFVLWLRFGNDAKSWRPQMEPYFCHHNSAAFSPAPLGLMSERWCFQDLTGLRNIQHLLREKQPRCLWRE